MPVHGHVRADTRRVTTPRRLRSLLLGLFAIGATLTGCGFSSDSNDPPQRTAAELATIQAQSPMARSTAAANSTATADAAAWTATPAPPTATADPSRSGVAGSPALAAGLLQAGDLGGATWAIDRQNMSPPLEMCGAASIDATFAPAAMATAVFTNSLSGWLQQWVYWMPGNAAEAVAYAEANFTCEFGEFPLRTANTIKTRPFNATIPGDAGFGRLIDLEFSNPAYDPLRGHVVVMQVGDFVVVIGQLDFYQPDERSTLRHLERAIQRLQELDSTTLESSAAIAP